MFSPHGNPFLTQAWIDEQTVYAGLTDFLQTALHSTSKTAVFSHPRPKLDCAFVPVKQYPHHHLFKTFGQSNIQANGQ